MPGEMDPGNGYDWLYDPHQQPQPRVQPPESVTDTAKRPLRIGDWRDEPPRDQHTFCKLTLVAGLMAAAVLGVADRVDDGPPVASEVAPSQASCIAQLPLAVKVGQKLMLSATADTLVAESPVLARRYIGGVILMDQVPAATTRAFIAAQPVPPLVATDQEGGTVQRYKTEGALPSPKEMVATLSPDAAEKRIETDDVYLRSQGINMNLAPLADVAAPSGASILGSRVFSDDPKTVTLYDKAYLQAGFTAGILPTLKHFPGLGSASGNTDDGPATAPFSARDLAPYEALKSTQAAVMVGNQGVPGLTGDVPASLSRAAITDELRGKLGYQDNVVITDSLTARAITSRYAVADAVVKSWEAGADEALVVGLPAGLSSGQFVSQVVARTNTALQNGQLSETELDTSVGRIFALRQKGVDACNLAKDSP